ncbi:MAG: hypothetical protein E7332_08335 [Clostridiales bacterium]|nr:hypothetical protein [Clostridiales bacterium]
MNKITIELCAEDRARLDAIIDELQALTNGKPIAQPAPQDELFATVETVLNEVPITNPTEEEKPTEAPTVTADDVAKKVKELAKNDKTKKAVKALIQSYAERVSLIPEDKLAEVWGKLIKLED